MHSLHLSAVRFPPSPQPPCLRSSLSYRPPSRATAPRRCRPPPVPPGHGHHPPYHPCHPAAELRGRRWQHGKNLGAGLDPPGSGIRGRGRPPRPFLTRRDPAAPGGGGSKRRPPSRLDRRARGRGRARPPVRLPPLTVHPCSSSRPVVGNPFWRGLEGPPGVRLARRQSGLLRPGQVGGRGRHRGERSGGRPGPAGRGHPGGLSPHLGGW